MKYLANDLYRPPLHTRQIESATPQGVTFRYRDNQGVQHRATLTGEEFLRRFLQHVLPKRTKLADECGARRSKCQ